MLWPCVLCVWRFEADFDFVRIYFQRQRLGHVEMTSGQALLEVCAPDRRKLRLSPEQLLCIIREKISARTNSGPLQLRRAFKHFDPDGTGCVDSYEFQKVRVRWASSNVRIFRNCNTLI